jgi:hypothetical protein
MLPARCASETGSCDYRDVCVSKATSSFTRALKVCAAGII